MRTIPALILLLVLAPPVARAEKADASPESMRAAATHVIVGTVQAVYARQEREGRWQVTRYVAEVRVAADEKGGLAEGQLAYVRYWTRTWIAASAPPPSTSGHRGIPKEGETLRIYVVGKGHNGFGETTDGGLDVYGANGFERLPPPAGR
jgi:hypothetical protein